MHPTIMAIDPGLRATGAAVIDNRNRLRHASVIATQSADSAERRIRSIAAQVDELIRFYRPELLVLEATWPTSSPVTSLTHRVALACRWRARAHNVPSARVAATTLRRILMGDGWAGKWRVASQMVSIFPELRVYLHRDRAWKDRYFQNLFDAVALAVFAMRYPNDLTWTSNPHRTPRHRDR
jgi:Holliday junction resolvasome RuvABC endonuclease subunit